MDSKSYWKQRKEQASQRIKENASGYVERAEKAYTQAFDELQKNIDSWYRRFSENNGVSMAEARRLLTTRELRELKWSVEDYIKAGQENGVSADWAKALENASSRVHISRYEALQLQCQNQIEQLTGKRLSDMETLLGDVYKEQYESTLQTFGEQAGIDMSFANVPQKEIERVLKQPWSTDGKTFSDRIWKQQEALKEEFTTQFTRNLILGKAPDEMIEALAKKFETGKAQAATLAYTEASAFAATANQECYEDLGLDEYEILAIDYGGDGTKKCDFCASMEGKVFPMKDYQVGITAPPFHPNCGHDTVPYLKEYTEEEEQELLDKWREAHPEYLSESQNNPVDKTGKSDIMESELGTFKKKLLSDERMNAKYYAAIKEKFSHGSENAKKVFNRYVPSDSVADAEYGMTAFYNASNQKIYMNYATDYTNVRGLGATWFHEHGHMIDDLAGRISNNETFREALNVDYISCIESYKTKHNCQTLDEVKKAIGKDILDMRKHSAVADLINALSEGEIRGAAAHEIWYWKDNSVYCAEAFAHMFEAQFDVIRYGEMKKYFPTALKIFEEMLGGLV